MSSSNQSDTTRQRLRPWLESRINSATIPGLEWISLEQKIFKVPWKHVGNREWSESDGIIFKEWAIHTGRYREGIDQPDFPTWKTRFRCALTKLPDIKELRIFNNLDGQTDNPYRVYQFVPRNGNNGIISHQDSGDNDPLEYVDEILKNEAQPTIPCVVNTEESNTGRLASDLAAIDSEDLVRDTSQDCHVVMEIEMESVGNQMDISDTNMPNTAMEDIINIGSKPYPGPMGIGNRPLAGMMGCRKYWSLDQSDYKLYITIKYLLQTVFETLCSNVNGCRLFYDKQIPVLERNLYEQMYGPASNALLIKLPDCNIQNSQQKKLTLDLLQAADRGLLVYVKDGNIYVVRKCRCRIYISTPSINNGQTMKLERDQESNIFDLNAYFLPALRKYLHQLGPKPSAEIIVGFGQKFTLERESLNNLLVSAYIVHTEANNLLTTISCTDPLSPPIDLSRSDNIDQFMDCLQHGGHLASS